MTCVIKPKRKYLVHKPVKNVGVSGGHSGEKHRKRNRNKNAPEQAKRVMHLLPNGKVRMEDYKP